MSTVYHEITPLTDNDCFMVFARVKNKFDFPLHHHEEFELNFIEGAQGAKRIVGDNIEVIQNVELVLVGSNIPHGWFTNERPESKIHEITIQFHRDLFNEKLLQRNQLSFIRTMLERSVRGISFSPETIHSIKPRLLALNQNSGFGSVLELMSILHDLSISRNMHMLTSSSFVNENFTYNSRRLEKAFEFMKANYDKNISLEDMSKIVSMTEVGFSRFIKKRTGKTFIDSLNDIRLGHASRLLIDTTLTIAEVSYKCGFNNLSYFNRIFKKRYNCTPKEFRENYSGTRTFV
ncbi:AraC family transcriptional regulator [Runella sp.]|jgi:AraC-like DNA-binding protein|uniref:AraC family transcriptional regulator n=1 Tax=Runella sp. TaxID=1960881 RepID=UPI00262C223F|nr:AraC family transcriptional regulator [Runella sp.]